MFQIIFIEFRTKIILNGSQFFQPYQIVQNAFTRKTFSKWRLMNSDVVEPQKRPLRAKKRA